MKTFEHNRKKKKVFKKRDQGLCCATDGWKDIPEVSWDAINDHHHSHKAYCVKDVSPIARCSSVRVEPSSADYPFKKKELTKQWQDLQRGRGKRKSSSRCFSPLPSLLCPLEAILPVSRNNASIIWFVRPCIFWASWHQLRVSTVRLRILLPLMCSTSGVYLSVYCTDMFGISHFSSVTLLRT